MQYKGKINNLLLISGIRNGNIVYVWLLSPGQRPNYVVYKSGATFISPSPIKYDFDKDKIITCVWWICK